jgi:hypothetical protein
MTMPTCFDCPGCGRRLEQCGEVSTEGRTYPVFQCDDCKRIVEMFGEPFEVALTFAVDENGRAFDPADDGDDRPSGAPTPPAP